MTATTELVTGVVVTPLKKFDVPAGDVFHGIKRSSPEFVDFGEAYFSTINHNHVKGWRKHTQMTMNVIVPVGRVKFVIFDDRSDSPTKGQFMSETLSLINYNRLTIPPGLWVAFRGEAPGMNLILNIASIEHDPAEAINCDLNDISYHWQQETNNEIV